VAAPKPENPKAVPTVGPSQPAVSLEGHANVASDLWGGPHMGDKSDGMRTSQYWRARAEEARTLV
jgi:hypothetical protein